MADKQIRVVIAGLGARGYDIYGEYLNNCGKNVKITAVADINPERVERAKKQWGIAPENCFASAEEMLSKPCMGDAALICTQDRQHVPHAMLALKQGYNLLLEKPVSDDVSCCKQLLNEATSRNLHVVVCHVLRYTSFYRTIYNLINSGEIGTLYSIQAMEHIGYWHFAHSFVRGNWRNSKETSPMILAKCCHDMDILLWLAGKRAKRVSSYGGLNHFCAENAPKGAAKRCMDCTVRADCPYDAVKYYLESKKTGIAGGKTQWPVNVLAQNPNAETITEALKSGPYGRCVYACDNDVADNQVVNILLEDGAAINFTATAFTQECCRTIMVVGSHGSIQGNMETNTIILSRFGKEKEEINVQTTQGTFAGHGGGDAMMMQELVDLLQGNRTQLDSGLERSIESHIVALLAERSRLNGGESLLVE